MKPSPIIPEAFVINSFEHLEELSILELERLIEKMGTQQQIIFTFLLTMGESFFTEEENELLLYLGLGTWYIFGQYSGADPSLIKMDQLEKVQDENQYWLEQWTEGSEAEFYELLMSNEHSQPHLLHYLVEIVLDEDIDEMDEDHRGLMLIYAKIVLETFAINYLTPVTNEGERPHTETSS